MVFVTEISLSYFRLLGPYLVTRERPLQIGRDWMRARTSVTRHHTKHLRIIEDMHHAYRGRVRHDLSLILPYLISYIAKHRISKTFVVSVHLFLVRTTYRISNTAPWDSLTRRLWLQRNWTVFEDATNYWASSGQCTYMCTGNLIHDVVQNRGWPKDVHRNDSVERETEQGWYRAPSCTE
jgi:hypothetical protein